jgi:hypothetical protein
MPASYTVNRTACAGPRVMGSSSAAELCRFTAISKSITKTPATDVTRSLRLNSDCKKLLVVIGLFSDGGVLKSDALAASVTFEPSLHMKYLVDRVTNYVH